MTRQISRAALQLNRSGINDVVVLGLPEFGSLPGAIDVYNQRLGQKISFLDRVLPNSDFSFFDVNGLYQAVATQVPTSLIDTPCLLDPAGCAANPENYILYDEVHPSEWVHTILADALADEIGGTARLVASYDVQTSEVPAVPLPASAPLLLAGIFGLGIWSRRRRSPA